MPQARKGVGQGRRILSPPQHRVTRSANRVPVLFGLVDPWSIGGCRGCVMALPCPEGDTPISSNSARQRGASLPSPASKVEVWL